MAPVAVYVGNKIFYHPAAGKTGTTQGWTDAWFVGFSTQIAAGAWFGVDDPQVSLGKGQMVHGRPYQLGHVS
ncbi:MAG: hypothetical protein CM1200mP10_32070 [Candidatus Neomarinimicrobiota bacterium]|nr:MAG: hypothetical protein CM1200mP10_32070 [Candidatus Neomarinimicrobiota bacterium]